MFFRNAVRAHGAMLAGCLAFSAGERTSSAEPWLELNASYPLVLSDGSEPTNYQGILGIGARVGGTFRQSDWTVSLGLDYIQMNNEVVDAPAGTRAASPAADSNATRFNVYAGGAWPRGSFLLMADVGAGVVWRSFRGVGGLGLAADLTFDVFAGLRFGTDDKFFLGPGVELMVLSDADNSSLGSVTLCSGGLRFGTWLR